METKSGKTKSYSFVVNGSLLMASWGEDLSVESEEFFVSVLHLLDQLIENNITGLFLDSGTPEGGSLTEEVISSILKKVSYTKLEKIALLESHDFLWDQNLLQLAAFIKEINSLPYEFRIFPTQIQALDWLQAS